MTREKALEHKALGNADFTGKNYEAAIKHFTNAIAEDPTDHVFYSNRSACLSSLKQYEKALEDGKKCVEIKPDWAKGYNRKGLAEYFLKKYDEAEKTYEKGLSLAPADPGLTQGLQQVKDAKKAPPVMTVDPMKMMQAVQRNPKIAEYLKDQDLMQKVGLLMGASEDPSKMAGLSNLIQSDPRLLEVFLALNGMEMPEREEPKRPEAKKPKAEPKPEPVDERTEEQKKADAFKDEGNKLYKAKKFDEAIAQYDQAIETVPNDIIYYNNKCAVLLEQEKFEECEKVCNDLLTRRYEMNSALPGGASFEKVGKVYNRLASCFTKQKKYKEAMEMYEKSLAEDNNKNTRNLVRECEKLKQKTDKEAYVDTAKAEEHKAKGNEFFKEGKWVQAKTEYDEGVKRDPTDAKMFSNRAAVLMKLGAQPDALKDLEESIRLDPTFVKNYIRKGQCYFFMKDFNKALQAYEAGLKVDPESEECKHGRMTISMKLQGGGGGEVDPQQVQEAMKDPEIQAILKDPQVNIMLQQMQADPKAAGEIMQKDPKMANAVQKLALAGIIKLG